MPRHTVSYYVLENVNTSEVRASVKANSRKEAHEMGQLIWPGQPIEVSTEAEYQDRAFFRKYENQILDLLEGISSCLYDSDYKQANGYIGNICWKLSELREYFTHRMMTAATLAGEEEV